MKTVKPPHVIQAVFHDRQGHDIAHDYYLNASWVADLCQRHGCIVISPYITKAIDFKRHLCAERYGTEWGKEIICPHPEKAKRKPRKKTPTLS